MGDFYYHDSEIQLKILVEKSADLKWFLDYFYQNDYLWMSEAVKITPNNVPIYLFLLSQDRVDYCFKKDETICHCPIVPCGFQTLKPIIGYQEFLVWMRLEKLQRIRHGV